MRSMVERAENGEGGCPSTAYGGPPSPALRGEDPELHLGALASAT